MGIYKNGKHWFFEFRSDGYRFCASTRTTDRSAAEAMERTIRERVKQFGAADVARSSWRPPSARYRGLCACNEHAWAVLDQPYTTFVSPEDAHLLEWIEWCARQGGGRYSSKLVYAGRRTNGKIVRLHQEIMGKQDSHIEIDHKDHNPLNNRRENLRPGPHSHNIAAARRRPGVSGFHGVARSAGSVKKPWRGYIAGKHLGHFTTAEEAARAYDTAAIERWGEFASLNFPPIEA